MFNFSRGIINTLSGQGQNKNKNNCEIKNINQIIEIIIDSFEIKNHKEPDFPNISNKNMFLLTKEDFDSTFTQGSCIFSLFIKMVMIIDNLEKIVFLKETFEEIKGTVEKNIVHDIGIDRISEKLSQIIGIIKEKQLKLMDNK